MAKKKEREKAKEAAEPRKPDPRNPIRNANPDNKPQRVTFQEFVVMSGIVKNWMVPFRQYCVHNKILGPKPLPEWEKELKIFKRLPVGVKDRPKFKSKPKPEEEDKKAEAAPENKEAEKTEPVEKA